MPAVRPVRMVYADESGNLDFKRQKGASRYFSLVTLTCGQDGALAGELRELRRELALEGIDIHDGFHANVDPPDIRDRVFNVLERHSMRLDATLLDKPKAEPQVRRSEEWFYRFAWYFHMKHVGPRLVKPGELLHVVAATVGTRRKRQGFAGAVKAVMNQVMPGVGVAADWSAKTDYCLQAADYCAWAIFRKWEHGDASWYQRIRPAIQTEFDLFATGSKEYY